MRVFRDVEVVEALGSGMLRIMKNYSKDNFEFGDNYVRMIVPYNKTENRTERGIGTGLKTGLKNTTIDIKIVEIIKNTPTITYDVLAKKVGIVRSSTARHLSNLQKANIIRHVGSKKGGHWEVVKNEETE